MSVRNLKLGCDFLFKIIKFANKIINRLMATKQIVSFNICKFFPCCDLSTQYVVQWFNATTEITIRKKIMKNVER